MKKLKFILYTNNQQIAFGERLGLDFTNCTQALAYAKISDYVDKNFYGTTDLGSPTNKQIELALKHGFDISCMSKREVNAIIGDLMIELNLQSIEDNNLIPGAEVFKLNDESQTPYVISSISSNGTCYFRGGNGKKTWAGNLRRIEKKS